MMNRGINSVTINVGAGMGSGHLSEVISDPSSPESTFEDSDLFQHAMSDDVTAQLAAAGPIGIAAAAAIATSRKRKRPHSFETNPSIRKRQQTRLIRKMKATIEEYSTRVGQQAIVLTCTPGKSNQSSQSYKVFGSQPLENIIKNYRSTVMAELDNQLAVQMPLTQELQNSHLHELPPLTIDGIPTPVDKMTQAQLRAFIPEMLKFSTGRSKPGWGKVEYKPVWWPDDVPWANVRSDVRPEEVKRKVNWTHALRTIVRNCYRHHGRDDLLPEFTEDNGQHPHHQVQHQQQAHHQGATIHIPGQTVLQTISNPDGSMSIIQVETGDQTQPQIVTLPDGSQAQIVHAQTLMPGLHSVQNQTSQGENVHTVAQLQHSQATGVISNVDISSISQTTGINPASLTEATINQDGQIVLTADPSALGGVVSIPVSMYQTVVTNLPSLQQNLQVLPASSLHAYTNHEATNITAKQEADDGSGDGETPVEVVTIDSSQIIEDNNTVHSDS